MEEMPIASIIQHKYNNNPNRGIDKISNYNQYNTSQQPLTNQNLYDDNISSNKYSGKSKHGEEMPIASIIQHK